MAVPALRQPKKVVRGKPKIIMDDVQNVILTLKEDKSLVISSDTYHGVIRGREMYRCVFCCKDMELDIKLKESHKMSDKHKKMLESYPHTEDYGENLIREFEKDTFYCTLCNVIILAPFLTRHIMTEAHNRELDKAIARVTAYSPTE